MQASVAQEIFPKSVKQYRQLLWRLFPGLVVLGAASAILVSPVGGVQGRAVGEFGAYFLTCVVLPVVLIWRRWGPQLKYRIE